jgi:tyrosine-protein phosphatase SIW14
MPYITALRPPLKIARTMSSSGIDAYNPPDNFALVAGMVYRSSFPKLQNFAYLKKLGLKSIL